MEWAAVSMMSAWILMVDVMVSVNAILDINWTLTTTAEVISIIHKKTHR